MNRENIEERFLHLNLYGKGLISLSSTARNLDLSLRQVQRLVRRLKNNDWNPKVLLFNKKDVWNRREDLRDSIAILHNEKPQRSNPAIQYLLHEQGIRVSPSTIRRIRIEKNLYHHEDKVEKRYFKKFEAKRFGDLCQMDTTEGCWLEGRKVKLVMILDDYSRAILGFLWVKHDTAWNNMLVLKQVIEKYGVPSVIYTDNDSKFRIIRRPSRHFEYKKDCYETEIKRALKELDIALINHPPYQAFCKGKVERSFRFIQSRFVPEIKATNLEELNEEFSKWVEWYNANHVNRMTGCKPKERLEPNGFKPLSREKDLDYIFSLRKKRVIDKYNSFSFNSKRYFLESKDLLWGCKVTLALNPTHRIKVYHEDKFLKEFKIIK